MAKILVVGLNPAWQVVLRFSRFALGEVNRAERRWETAAGKGQNAAKVLCRLGHEVQVLQILGGETGRRLLGVQQSWGVQAHTVFVAGETRVATTLLAPGGATELLEPFHAGSGFEPSLVNLIRDAGFHGVLLCGSVPDGLAHGIFEELLHVIQADRVVMDSLHGLSSSLVKRLHTLKINGAEWDGLDEKLRREIRRRCEAGKLRLGITHGSKSALLMEGDRSWKYSIPRVSPAVNATGAGDTVTAVYAHGLFTGLSAPESFRHGLAAGSASVRTELPAQYNPLEARRLLAEVRMREDASPKE